jgi:hypothetical protein
MGTKDYVCSKPPFMSENLLHMLQTKGNRRCSVRYLEYLCLKCNVQDRNLHTSLGCLYVKMIQEGLIENYPSTDGEDA